MSTQTKNKKSIVTTTAIVPSVNIRPMAAIMSDIQFDKDNNASLKPGFKVTVDELVTASVEMVTTAESAYIKAANTLRLTRNLPNVKSGEDDKTEGRPAFEVASEMFRNAIARDSVFYNMLQMVAAVDVVETNKLKSSPFAVKEALGALRAAGAVPTGEGKPLTLTNGDGAKAKALVQALKDGVGVNKARPLVAELNEKLGKKKKAKRKSANGNASGSTPTVNQHTPALLKAALTAIIGQWELTVKGSSVDATRTECRAEVETLAKLAGLVTVIK